VRRALLVAALLTAAPRVASANLDPSRAAEDLRTALDKGGDSFCKNPSKPLTPRAVMLCAHAKEIPNCEGFAAACAALEKDDAPKQPPKWLDALLQVIAPLAKVLLWVVVVAVVLALAVPLIRAWLRTRRDRAVADEPAPKPAQIEVAAAEEALEISDAEVLLARAGEHERRGELSRALSTYLAAALRGLDVRGAIHLERHRTNGEYVRSCNDPDAKRALREIVRDVDHVEFGGAAPTTDAVTRASKRAIALVRTLPLALFALLASCISPSTFQRGGDPAGDELFTELLRGQGLTVSRAGPLSSLPLPTDDETAPTVVLDASRTPMDEETDAHVIRWIKAGGTLVLVGAPASWPGTLKSQRVPATSREITVRTWEDDEQVTYRAHVVHAAGFSWPAGFAIAFTGDEVTWAATRELGKGRIIAMADVDLITNAGLARPGNADAAIALLATIDSREVKIARPEDGTSPPSNPFIALVRAGLGLGLLHALIATMVLFLAVGVRLSRPNPVEAPRRRAFVEHIEATGALWARTRLAAHALSVYGRYVEERLRAEGRRDVDDAALARARAARSDETPRGDELKTMKELGDVLTGK
jgi:hypothetical protein